MLSQACKIISQSGLFDEHYYATQLKLNQLTSRDPLVHFIMEGWQMGLCPNFLFDCRFYTSQIESLGGQVTVNPLLHYIIEGHKTEARTSPFFDPTWYIRQYDDVLHSGTPPLAHFLQFGLLEGRSPAARIPQLLLPEIERTHAQARGISKGALLQASPRQTGRKNYDIIICLHEASRTGAPMVGLNLAKRLTARGYNCLLITLEGGDILPDLKAVSDTLDLSHCDNQEQVLTVQLYKLRQSKQLIGKPAVFFNSAASAKVSGSFPDNQYKRIALIHEFMTGYSASFQRLIVSNVDKLVFSSQSVRDNCTLLPHFRGQFTILAQGLLEENFGCGNRAEARQFLCDRLGISADSFVVLACGTVEPRKGVDIFVQAANQILQSGHKDIDFIWVGGEQTTGYEALKWTRIDLQQAGLNNRVHFVDKQSVIEPYFTGADIFALPSRQDPLPCVLHLAMSAALPVVAFRNSGGAEDVLAEGGGTLVDYGNSAKLAAAILNYHSDPALRRKDGEQGRKLVREKYCMNRYVDELLALTEDRIDLNGNDGLSAEKACGTPVAETSG